MRSKRHGTDNRKLFVLAVFAMGMILTMGCGGGGGTPSSTTGGSSPGISLSTGSIEFGNVVVGRSAERSITAKSMGTANLTIGQITNPDLPFSILSDACSNKTLKPGVSCVVTVQFEPTVQQDGFSGSLVIPSSDANNGSLPVSLFGNGKGLNVVITDVILDGCTFPATASVAVSVTDGNNNPVGGLPENAFTVNGVALSNSNFENIQAVPISVALALDFSRSIVWHIGATAMKEAAGSLINSLRDTDRANVYKFAEIIDPTDAEATFVTTDAEGKAVLIEALNRTPVFVGTPTLLFDAVDFAVQKAAAENNGRRIVLLVTDGLDDGSVATLNGVIEKALQQSVYIFTVGLGEPEKTDIEVLQRMAAETGGLYFSAADGVQLEGVYNQISIILGNLYQFDVLIPAQVDSLKVEVEDGTGLRGDDTVLIPNC